MVITADILWYIQPFQIFSTLGTAVNFGGSVLQSPLIMPMLQMPQVPVKYAGQQTAYLLHNSEYFFPPLNAACTLTNLLMTIIAYLNRGSHPVASAKLPYLGMATAANIATTAYALLIMVPMNKKQVAIAENLKNGENENEEKELRRLQKKWAQLNYGRAMFMIGGSLAGMMGLLVQDA